MALVREVRPGDMEYVAAHMREADRREVYAVAGVGPMEALRLSVESSGVACTVEQDGKPVALFGVSPLSEIEGSVWLLGTDGLVRPPVRRQFLEQGRRYFDLLHDYRPLLTNYVDERNVVHIRWLKWCGCHFIQRHDRCGVEQRPCLEFVRIKQPCAQHKQP